MSQKDHLQEIERLLDLAKAGLDKAKPLADGDKEDDETMEAFELAIYDLSVYVAQASPLITQLCRNHHNDEPLGAARGQ